MHMNGDIPITPRQLELLSHVASGLTIDQAAEKIVVAPRSAYNMLGTARDKAGVSTTTRLVIVALREGWLEMDDEGQVAPAAQLAA